MAAAIAGYAGINAAGFAAAVQIGIQPELFQMSTGPRSTRHTTRASPSRDGACAPDRGRAAEAIMTAGVLAFLLRTDAALLVPNQRRIPITADGQVPAPTG